MTKSELITALSRQNGLTIAKRAAASGLPDNAEYVFLGRADGTFDWERGSNLRDLITRGQKAVRGTRFRHLVLILGGRCSAGAPGRGRQMFLAAATRPVETLPGLGIFGDPSGFIGLNR